MSITHKRIDKNMFDITIIEDDYALNNGISLALKSCGYHTEQLYKLSDFKKDRKTNLIILDINLPDGNGFAFLKDLRTTSNVPVVILTANDLETDEVMGLELGADDYITKPFSLMVLRARIEKVLKKKLLPQNIKMKTIISTLNEWNSFLMTPLLNSVRQSKNS